MPLLTTRRASRSAATVGSDRWFREQGLPTFVPLRRWFTDLPRRVAPLLVAVTCARFLLGDVVGDSITVAVEVLGGDEWLVFGFVLLILAISAVLAWVSYGLVRVLLRRLRPVPGTVIATLLMLVCLVALVYGGYLFRAHATVAPAFEALGVVLACMLVIGMGGSALFAWATRLAVRNASAVGHMASIALPVILMLVVFAFFSGEVWQMASATGWGGIALVGLVVAVLAVLVVLRVCASEIDETRSRIGAAERIELLAGTPLASDGSAEPEPQPLRLPQRINLLLVMAVAQLIQALLFAALIWALLVLIGGIAIPIGIVELWVGPGTPDHPLEVQRLVIGGAQLPLTVNLLKAAALLAVIAALPFVFSAVSEARYRERFFDPIIADMRRAMVARDALLARGRSARRTE